MKLIYYWEDLWKDYKDIPAKGMSARLKYPSYRGLLFTNNTDKPLLKCVLENFYLQSSKITRK